MWTISTHPHHVSFTQQPTDKNLNKSRNTGGNSLEGKIDVDKYRFNIGRLGVCSLSVRIQRFFENFYIFAELLAIYAWFYKKQIF